MPSIGKINEPDDDHTPGAEEVGQRGYDMLAGCYEGVIGCGNQVDDHKWHADRQQNDDEYRKNLSGAHGTGLFNNA